MMNGNGVAGNTNIPNYIVDMMRYNYIALNKYYFLYDFEDPITHLVILHPKVLLAATELKINLKDKFKIIAAYKSNDDQLEDPVEMFLAHNEGRAVDLLANDIDKNTLAAFAERAGFNVVKVYDHYVHAEIEFKTQGVPV